MAVLQTPALTLAINAGTTSDGNALATSTSDITPLTAACEIQGAQKLLNLYFQLSGGSFGTAPINQQLPGGFSLAFNGKATASLEAGTLLFSAGPFLEKQAGSLFYYQAFLDLNKTEIGTALDAGDGDLLACTADIDLDLPAADGVPALQAVYQVTLNLKRQAYTGTEAAPTPATPAYPPGVVVSQAIANVSFAPAVTSVGDAAAGSLEAVPTAALAVPALRTLLTAAGDLQNWVLVASDAADASFPDGSPSILRPTDFDANNPKAWFRK